MSSDIHEQFTRAAASPLQQLDVHRALRRGRRQRLAQALAAVGGAAILIVGGAAYGFDGGWFGDDERTQVASGCGGRISIYLRFSATTRDVSRIKVYLARHDDVEKVTYVSKEDAYEEFEREHGPVSGSLPLDALPASFRVDVRHEASIGGLVEDVRRFDAVDDVAAPPPGGSGGRECG